MVDAGHKNIRIGLIDKIIDKIINYFKNKSSSILYFYQTEELKLLLENL
jgi:hypothetical protein